MGVSMDSRTRLDYALFQLTPTRTRCDLVVVSGGITEKLASGLSQPFLTHLKFAKDEISKGGYSIKLCPAANAAPWFTKATFERFVRFVSTPEVLERFVSLEKEISQIDDSFQASEPSNTPLQLTDGRLSDANGIGKKSTDATKLPDESEQTVDVKVEESSKFHLQRILESRKALLRKEQTMAYARALVAGFEMDDIDELIFFADTFGASRLREACINFKDLCKKKHADVLWLDELAAMEACAPSELSFLGTSGIVLTNGHPNGTLANGALPSHNLSPNGSLSASISDSTISYSSIENNKDLNSPAADQTTSADKVQVQMSWPNQIPPYAYNFQTPVQQGPPYQGYPFPIMQPVGHYHPMNMQWPPVMDESIHSPVQPNYRRKSSSVKKEKISKQKKSEYSEEEENSGSGDSYSGTDSDSYVAQDRKHSSTENPSRKKHRKKSSKTVVIRNINYITSKKGGGEKGAVSDESSSVEDEFFGGDSLKQIEDAVGSLEKHHKSSSRKHKKKGGNTNGSIVDGPHAATVDNLEAPDASEPEERQENWDTFQNLLMRDEETTNKSVEKQQPVDVHDEHFTIKSSGNESSFSASHPVDLESEKVAVQRTVAVDSFVVADKDEGYESRIKFEVFENGENFRPSMKRTDEELLFSNRIDDSRVDPRIIPSDSALESSVIKNRKGEDWFIVNPSGKSENQDGIMEQTFIDGDNVKESCHPNIEKSRKDTFSDDSFMVQARSTIDDHYDSQWKTDINITADLSLVGQPENGTLDNSQNNHENKHDLDDSCVVLERNYISESPDVSWSMDYGIDSFTEPDKKCEVIETNNHVNDKITSNKKEAPLKKEPGKEAKPTLRRSLGKSKSEITSMTRKPSSITRPATQKSKLEKEEEMRRRTEELVIERQRRIAERTAARSLPPATSKKIPAKASIKDDKNKTQPKAR